jgi:hypothetical protein
MYAAPPPLTLSLLSPPALLLPGIKRSHLLDARLDGGLLLELYSRDGVGTMISTDFYEGGWFWSWRDGRTTALRNRAPF